MNRSKLVQYLDEYLNITSIPDSSLNGLQVEGSGQVRRIAVAVDACLKTIQAAARLKSDMLIVHHGLFWGRNERITGVMYRRIAALVQHRISLYAAHLPLDCHAEVGNNIELVRLLELEPCARFGSYRGVEIGFVAETEKALTRRAFVNRIEAVLRAKAELLTFGPSRVKRVGIISGEAAVHAPEAQDQGCDTFVTGETSHVAYHLAKEAKINLVYAGHYASETVGVKALARHLQGVFSLDWRFISAPTGY